MFQILIFFRNQLMLRVFLSASIIGIAYSFGPFSAALTLAPLAATVWEYFNCHTYECCHDRWITRNETNLKIELNERLYGQPFASKVIVLAY